MTRLRNERGMSLVEVTIILLVLMLLTGVLAPSIFDFVIDAKWVKVKEDCEAIGVSTARMVRDVGHCFKHNGAGVCDMTNRVDLLYSDGPVVVPTDVDLSTAPTFNSANAAWAQNWWNDFGIYGDTMENQFVTNSAGYLTPYDKFTYYPVGPQYNLGWRGAYLASPIGPDPWGSKYLVNSIFLGSATNATLTGEGAKGMWWDRDVFCISPGPDRIYQTYFGGSLTGHGTVRQADDFIYIIQGSGR